jgi:hypothetical protein
MVWTGQSTNHAKPPNATTANTASTPISHFNARMAYHSLVDWKKVAEALFSDITSSPAGKRRDQRKSRGTTFAGCLAAGFVSAIIRIT